MGKMKSLGAPLLSLALTGVLASAAAASDAPSGNVARWVATARKVGTAEAKTPVTISVYLKFKDSEALDALIKAQTTPGDALFGRYLTPAEFHARFAPDKADVAKVAKALRAAGFTIDHSAKSGFYIAARGTVGKVEEAFHVTQNLYSFHDKTLRANAEEPKLPEEIASLVSFVGGLDETGLLTHPMHVGLDGPALSHDAPPGTYGNLAPSFCSSYWGDHSATVSPAPAPYAAKLPWLNCGYTPQQIREAYGSNLITQTGKGVRVAIVDAFASPTIFGDANLYAANHSLPKLTAANFTQVVPTGIYGVSATNSCGPQGWYVEESLDVAAVHSMAPGADIVYVGAESCDDTLFNALYDTIDTGIADIITNSWSDGGEFSSADENAVVNAGFRQAVSEGISVLFSSGDDGDLSQDNGVASGTWPATSPYVTAVGGTTLELVNKKGEKSEFGWGTYRAYLDSANTNAAGTTVTNKGVELPYSFYSGSGGGPSLSQLQPGYQQGVVPASLSTGTYALGPEYIEPIPFSSPHRVTPDISMDADPYSGFLIGITFTKASPPTVDSGCKAYKSSKTLEYCEFGEGGTSLASPLFAGVLALVDQQRLAKGLKTIGFVNPLLYRLKVGVPGSTASPLVDVKAPSAPNALLRGYADDPTKVRVVTVNSLPNTGCTNGICEGLDDFFYDTTGGYDEVTGRGTPYLPMLIKTLGE